LLFITGYSHVLIRILITRRDVLRNAQDASDLLRAARTDKGGFVKFSLLFSRLDRSRFECHRKPQSGKEQNIRDVAKPIINRALNQRADHIARQYVPLAL